MLTAMASPVDAAARAVMWSITQIAERDGVSKQAISKAVKRLAEHSGLTVERDGKGRITAVNVALYDHLRGQYRDPSKDQRPPAADAGPRKSDTGLDEALRQRTWIEAERSRIRLAAERGELVQVTAIAAALVSSGEDISRAIDKLSGRADELAVAFEREGLHGLRVALKRIAFQLRGEVAQALDEGVSVSGAAPSGNPADGPCRA